MKNFTNSKSFRMTTRPCMKTMVACVGMALAQWGAGPAFADSAVGVDTALGNAINPPGRSGVPRTLATDGFDTVRRSPTGQLYGLPYEPSQETNKTANGWEYSGGIDLGVLGNDAGTKNATYRKYKDLKNGAYLDYFEVEAEKADTANYVQAFGGGTGQADQFYAAQFGRYNDWKVKLFYSESLHVFTDSFKSFYNGAGTGNLTLPGGLLANGGAMPITTGAYTLGQANYVGATSTCTPAAPCWRYTGPDGVVRTFSNVTAASGINWSGAAGAAGVTSPAGTVMGANSIAAQINTYLNGVEGNTELSLVRQKGGATGEIKFTDNWKGYASYTQEQRKGTRPFAMNENNYTVELPEPIDYTTHDFLAGISYTDKLTQANLRASASLFRNNINTLTVQQPWLAAATGFGASQTSTFDLNPDNDSFNVKGEFARNLPDFYKGRFNAALAFGSNRQDDTLQLPVSATQSAQIQAAMGTSIIPGINNPGYATNTFDLKNWDGTNGFPLSQSTAKQKIDSTLVNLGLSVRPTDALSLKGDLRLYDIKNHGGYIAYNPVTAQFGRGFVRATSFDLTVGSSGVPGAINVPCYTLPGFPVVPGCKFNGVIGNASSTNNPANIPVFMPARETTQTNYVVSADYDLGKGASINGALEREDFHRTDRERENTWENKFKLGYVNRGFENATVRLSYEDASRRGSVYEFWPTSEFGTGLPGLDWTTIAAQLQKGGPVPGWVAAAVAPATQAVITPALQGYFARYALESRKFDQADRDQQIFNARLNYNPREDMDLGVTLQHKDMNYPNSPYGLSKDRAQSVSLDASYQPSSDHQLYGYMTWQDVSKTMRGNTGNGVACTVPTGSTKTVDELTVLCSNTIWVPTSAWNADTSETTNVLGVGYQTSIGRMKFGLDYAYTKSTTSLKYGYGALSLTPALAAIEATSPFEDMSFTQNTLTAHLLIPIQKKISAHLMYRHESGQITDWHYTGLPIGASAPEGAGSQAVILDAGPQNYHTNTVGVMLQFLL